MSTDGPANRAAANRPHHLGRYALIALVLAIVLGVWGVASRLQARAALSRQAAEEAIPTVALVKPSHGPPSEVLVLPGNVQAFYEAPIYARTNGYLQRWYVDIGTHVKTGQQMALIDTPEVDQQLNQAQADLATAVANEKLSATTNVRWQGLLATDSVSKQDADDKAGDYAAKQAATESARANVKRLQDLESFKRVLAPFDGVVTLRNTDIGALINAGSGGAAGSELFRVADTHKLRVYVQVPQPYAGLTRPGIEAQLDFSDHPGKGYRGSVVSTADAIDPATRTLLTQLWVDNDSGELLPGAYAQVHFKLPSRTDTVRVPANTLLFRSAGLQLAVVGADSHVSLKDVTMGRDFGNEVEILTGISATDQVVLNPPDSLADGQQVRITAPVSPESKAAT